ncbi:hypothetical protein GCM10027047_14550 [Rhodococcus aerolatus]
MSAEPVLVPRDALRDVHVAISVSDSADLSRLGLAQQHCELAVAEIARAILIAGGTVVYGGRLVPAGFTQILFDEVGRFADDREALIICVPQSEHVMLSANEIRQLEEDASSSVTIRCLDEGGQVVLPSERDLSGQVDVPLGLSAMRSYVTKNTAARVVIGGRLMGQQGPLPGVLEEIKLSLEASQPIYVAGGFGGAAYAAARAMNLDGGPWASAIIPFGGDKWTDYLASLEDLAPSAAADGLTDIQRRQLAVTHRPADIAALTVSGLSRAMSRR